ncbi:MAG: hypothetical protein WBB52_01575, partial [Acidimicrobiales bacterium]
MSPGARVGMAREWDHPKADAGATRHAAASPRDGHGATRAPTLAGDAVSNANHGKDATGRTRNEGVSGANDR